MVCSSLCAWIDLQVERFRREKLADFKRIILDYIQMQIEYSRKVLRRRAT